jgi:outer membrane protein assembly factor BamB
VRQWSFHRGSNPFRLYARHVAAVGVMTILSVGGVLADNWPHWRGPAANGVSAEKNLPDKWSPEENIAWKLDLPAFSGSTPIIWGETIFVNVAEAPESGDLYLWSLNRKDGSVNWKKLLGPGNHRERKQNMSSPSPVTDGKVVYVMTGTGVLKSFDFSGKELWTRDFQKDYGAFGLNWGYASSPLMHQDALYVQVLHGMKTDDPSYVVRIDRASGKTVWKVERPTDAIRESPDSYTTPALLTHSGKTEIVVTGGDVVTGHDLATGKELWRMRGLNPDNNPAYRIVASPVVFNGIIYAPTRVRPLLAIKAGGAGDITDTHKLWSFDKGPDVPTPVTDGQHFYTVSDSGVVHCLDAKTGAVLYGPERIRAGTYSSSLVLADGKLYITSEDGVTTVFRAGPKFEVIAENDLKDYTLSSVAISEGQLFLRTRGSLWAIGQRKK